MFTKKYRTILPLLLTALTLAACGQISVGVVNTTESNPPADVQDAAAPLQTLQSPTPEPGSPTEPVVEPGDEAETLEYSIPTMAFLGRDNNLWLLEAGSETPRQLTNDANPIGGEFTAVDYLFPRISSDGTILAYRRDVSTPAGNESYDVESGLWVMDLRTGEQILVAEGFPAGMAWKPGTHLLAYGTAVETDYFFSRDQPDPDLAVGIRAIDLDSGETMELVAPERGYALSSPQWSPDGRFLAFTEVYGMEGSGYFAYYDLATEAYYSWEEPVGFVSWSPNGGLLTYARQTYVATGEERLYLRGRGDVEQLLGPEYEGPAYATLPVFSPAGDRIAYLAFLEGPDTNVGTVMVLDLDSGETQAYGQFEAAWELAWVPDGSHVVLHIGPWEARQIIALNFADGSHTVLAEGSHPSLAGQ